MNTENQNLETQQAHRPSSDLKLADETNFPAGTSNRSRLLVIAGVAAVLAIGLVSGIVPRITQQNK